MFRFSFLACCRLFLCDSSLSPHPGYKFLSVVFRETLIFSQANFTPAYIKLFNSVMSFVGIFVNESIIFSVSDLTLPQSWFLREGNVIFFLEMILLMISTFTYSSWLNIFICVFVVYWSLPYCVWLIVFGFPVSSVTAAVLEKCKCVCHYICWWKSSISRSKN